MPVAVPNHQVAMFAIVKSTRQKGMCQRALPANQRRQTNSNRLEAEHRQTDLSMLVATAAIGHHQTGCFAQVRQAMRLYHHQTN